MIKHTPFPSIGQLRNVLHTLKLHYTYAGRDENDVPIYDDSLPLPKLKFTGTVKLHGTNSAICQQGADIWFQSRTNVVTPGSDNAGFATNFSNDAMLEKLGCFFSDYRRVLNVGGDNTLALYGEWCGGSIQKGVALNQLDKRFVIFGLKEKFPDETPSIWHPILGLLHAGNFHEIEGIYNILDYPTYEVEIDLNDPAAAVTKIDELTAQVEAECPYGAKHSVSGVGEGIVWTTTLGDGTVARFKSKGEKHSVSVKREKTPIAAEKLAGIEEFVEYAVTENRLEQACEQLFKSQNLTPTVANTGDIIKWIIADVVKEEIDTLSTSGLNIKDVSGGISKKTREWFFAKLDKQAGL